MEQEYKVENAPVKSEGRLYDLGAMGNTRGSFQALFLPENNFVQQCVI